MNTAERFIDYLNASPTPHHAVQASIDFLAGRGFEKLDLTDKPSPLTAGHLGYVQDEGSLFVFRVGKKPTQSAGFRIIAAHTDSPNLRIKPQPIIRSQGYIRLGLAVYGGVMVPTWIDRDLGIAGQVHLRDGEKNRSELVRFDRPLCRVSSAAIHLNREVNTKGLKLNSQNELPAVLCMDNDDEDPIRSLLSMELDVPKSDILTWDLSLFDLQPSCLAGLHEEFVHSGRLDNLGSCFPALDALRKMLDEELPDATTVIALFDHEEVGSQTGRGANSRMLGNVLRRIVRESEEQGLGSFSRVLAHSWLLSADMAHAVHPAFVDKHDHQHMPRINQGPVIKQNANRRYSTEGQTSAAFLRLCEDAEVPVQWYVHRSDLRCGSTVGPMLSARLGIRSLDVGNPMLSMHSIREQSGAKDVRWMQQAMRAFCLSSSMYQD